MSHRIVRVDENEFEMDDGTIYQHPEPLDEVPSLEEFQTIYDNWKQIIEDERRKISQS